MLLFLKGSPISTEISEFQAVLRRHLEQCVEDTDLDDLDDQMVALCREGNARSVIPLATILEDLYREFGREVALEFALNTLTGAYCLIDDFSQACKTFARVVDLAVTRELSPIILSAAENLWNSVSRALASVDVTARAVSQLVRLYTHFDFPEETLAMLLEAANRFSECAAHQHAYRALADAEKIARENRSGEDLLKVLEMLIGVAGTEEDHEYLIKKATEYAMLARALGRQPAPHALLNLATAHMRISNFIIAEGLFNRVLHSAAPQSCALRLATLMNLSACRRQRGKLRAADRALFRARRIASCAAQSPENMIELELIAAKNSLAQKRSKSALRCLVRASGHLDELVASAERPHYRRGVRERYVKRVEQLAAALPDHLEQSSALKLIASTRVNMTVDWIHLLTWAKNISEQPEVPQEVKAALSDALSSVAQDGAPFPYGYREKYDDALQGGALLPWDKLTTLVSELQVKHGAPNPLDNSRARNVVSLLQGELAKGRCILAPLWPGSGGIAVFQNRRCDIIRVSEEVLQGFYKSRVKYECGEISIGEFSKSLTAVRDMLVRTLGPALEAALANGCTDFLVMPHALDSAPLHLGVVEIENVRRALSNGACTVRTCPAIVRGESSAVSSRHIVVVRDEAEDLHFSKAEVDAVWTELKPDRVTVVDPIDTDGFLGAMQDADALIVATHGFPLSRSVDPFWTNLSNVDKHCINVPLLQVHSRNWPHTCVLLNACHSGSQKAGNAYRNFYSYDGASYPVTLLLNRRCSVVAAKWRVADKVAYIFNRVFLRNFREQGRVDQAFARTVAFLRLGSGAELLSVLQTAADSLGEAQSEVEFPAERLEKMCHHPYYWGTFELYSLL